MFNFDDPAMPLEAAATAHRVEVALHVRPFNHPNFHHFPEEYGLHLDCDALDPEALLSRRVAVPMIEIKRKVYGIQTNPCG